MNDSYDYNPLNKDNSSKSTEIKTKWIYNWEEALEINKSYRLFKLNEIPEPIGNLITSDPNELSISVQNDYFKDWNKYAFDLEITSTKLWTKANSLIYYNNEWLSRCRPYKYFIK